MGLPKKRKLYKKLIPRLVHSRKLRKIFFWTAIFIISVLNLFIASKFAFGNNVESITHEGILKSQFASQSQIAIIGADTISPQKFQEMDIKVRSYPMWAHDFPCVYDFTPESKDTGFIFIKLHKCASTTVARIIRRISAIYGRKHKHLANQDFKCKLHSKHGFAFGLQNIQHRKRNQTYLFTFIREPTERFISDFFYHGVSKNHTTPSFANFTKFVDFKTEEFRGLGGYEFPYLLTDRSVVPPQTEEYIFWNPRQPESVQTPGLLRKRVEHIIHDYDFIGVTSRMDESLVAFSMLLKMPLANVIYLHPRKVSGNYEYDKKRQICFKIQKSALTDDMKEYLDSDGWKAKIAGDNLLFKAANLSLDQTIENIIGKDIFDRKLEMYRRMMKAIQNVCGGEDCDDQKCTSTGELREKDLRPRDPKCNIDNCLKAAFSN
jgi:hypothetical protein